MGKPYVDGSDKENLLKNFLSANAPEWFPSSSGKWCVRNAVFAGDLEKRGEASQGSGGNVRWQMGFSIGLKALWRVLNERLKLL